MELIAQRSQCDYLARKARPDPAVNRSSHPTPGLSTARMSSSGNSDERKGFKDVDGSDPSQVDAGWAGPSQSSALSGRWWVLGLDHSVLGPVCTSTF